MKLAFLSRISNSGSVLLLLTIFELFILPVLPELWYPTLYPLCFMALFITAAFALKGARKIHLTSAISLSVIQLVAAILNLEWVLFISKTFQVLYFLVIVIALVKEIYTSKTVDSHVIMNAITAYFLLGIAFSIIVSIISAMVPNGYNIDTFPLHHADRYLSVREMSYYTFITYTTTGYGEIVPTSPGTKSLAILISTSGQLYIAIILAMLVGKYSTAKQ